MNGQQALFRKIGFAMGAVLGLSHILYALWAIVGVEPIIFAGLVFMVYVLQQCVIVVIFLSSKSMRHRCGECLSRD